MEFQDLKNHPVSIKYHKSVWLIFADVDDYFRYLRRVLPFPDNEKLVISQFHRYSRKRGFLRAELGWEIEVSTMDKRLLENHPVIAIARRQIITTYRGDQIVGSHKRNFVEAFIVEEPTDPQITDWIGCATPCAMNEMKGSDE